jgi:hypothetical protein
MRFEQVSQAQHDPLTFARTHSWPGALIEGTPCGRDCKVDILDIALGNVGNCLATRGIDHGKRTSSGALDETAVDE